MEGQCKAVLLFYTLLKQQEDAAVALTPMQKWCLQMSGCNYGDKIELRLEIGNIMCGALLEGQTAEDTLYFADFYFK